MFPLGTKPQISLKKWMLPMFKKTSILKGFDRESRPRPFKTMFPRSDFSAFL